MEVLRLSGDAKENRVAGVLVLPRATDTDRRVARELRADLVVDTTGRASRSPRWLQELGYEPPQETVIDAHLGYASRLYRIPENFGFEGVKLPENFIVLGDAACAFNPVYGQGMTIASLGALTLRQCLREPGLSLPGH